VLDARGITHLIVMGVTTEVCVQTTLREANDRGLDCLLLEDGTESYFPAFKEATLAMVRAQGAIVGWTAPSAALLAALPGIRHAPDTSTT
jgi:nicotinamidase-related amidase